MSRTKKLVFLSLLSALALVVYVIEAQIPLPIPIPGVKLGLSNMISLTTLLIFGPIECIIVLVIRIFLGSILTGSFSSLLFSLSGGLISNLGMIGLYLVFGDHISIWVISIVGSILHNIGQLLIAALIIQNLKIYYYLPILLVSAIITGFFVGLGSNFLSDHLNKLKYN